MAGWNVLRCKVFIAFLITVCMAGSVCLAEEGLQTIKGKYCTILLDPDVSPERINRNMGSTALDGIPIFGLFASDKYSDESLVEKFDAIYIKAQKILDMYPPNVRVKIRIYKNQSQLNELLSKINGQQNHPGRLISYYIHDYGTIYTTEGSISKKIIAHEMGHVITEHYFTAKIPAQIQELMAQYVEMHIDN